MENRSGFELKKWGTIFCSPVWANAVRYPLQVNQRKLTCVSCVSHVWTVSVSHVQKQTWTWQVVISSFFLKKKGKKKKRNSTATLTYALETMSSTDGWTDRRTDKVNPVYTPSNFVGRGYKNHYNMTVWILAGNYISFTIAAGLIRLHMPGVKKSRV